jgi:spermidine synthase
LVFVDVFKGRVVPDFATTPLFLKQCRDSLAPGGILAFNYIENDRHKWEEVHGTIACVFPGCQVVSRDDSRILTSSPAGGRGS